MYLPICSAISGNIPLCQMASYIGAPLLYGGARVEMPYYFPQVFMPPCVCCQCMQHQLSAQKNIIADPPGEFYGEEYDQYYAGNSTTAGKLKVAPGFELPLGGITGIHGLPIEAHQPG